MSPARRGSTRTHSRAREVTPALLRRMPLPPLDDDDDKESRGRVLVVGGGRQVPGAILLAGVGALRAGAGKLQMATVRDAAVGLALAVPESLVVGLPQWIGRGHISILVRWTFRRTTQMGDVGAPDRSRTCSLRLRRPTLYPVELRAREVVGPIMKVTSSRRFQ